MHSYGKSTIALSQNISLIFCRDIDVVQNVCKIYNAVALQIPFDSSCMDFLNFFLKLNFALEVFALYGKSRLGIDILKLSSVQIYQNMTTCFLEIQKYDLTAFHCESKIPL